MKILETLKKLPPSELIHIPKLTLMELKKSYNFSEKQAKEVREWIDLTLTMLRTPIPKELVIKDSEILYKFFSNLYLNKQVEIVFGVYLNNKLNVLCIQELSTGSIDLSIIDTRTIFIRALECKASGLVLVHNHPSGDPFPSTQDLSVTETIENAGKILNIPLYDHLVIGHNNYTSIFRFRQGLSPSQDL